MLIILVLEKRGDSMKMGEKIAKGRKKLNMTQDQLAAMLDVTRQTVSKWESDLAFPETAKLTRLAKVLKLNCDYLLQDQQEEEEVPVVSNGGNYTINWNKLYPILGKYQSTVDCEYYHKKFAEMMHEMMAEHNYSVEDAVLVLKDLLYQVYLQTQKEQKEPK